MSKYAMVFDKEKCIGCNACVVACQQGYQLPPDNKLNWVLVNQKGKFPNVIMEFVPALCAHCEDPICVKACPVEGATYKTKEGFVLVDEAKCIGCGACVNACPYGARSINAESNKAVKCSFCASRVSNGEAPLCVNTCITDARIFGDIDDPNSEVSKLMKEKQPKQLGDPENINPQVFYL